MPSWELFEDQPQEYRDQVLPPNLRARVSVEAGTTKGWERYVGLDGASVGMTTFGASAPIGVLYEKFGITAANVDSMKNSKDPEVLRLLGVEGNQGAELGLSKDWAYQIIKQIGNYGEMYERHVGANTPLKLTREGSTNALWTKGGLHYPMPFR